MKLPRLVLGVWLAALISLMGSTSAQEKAASSPAPESKAAITGTISDQTGAGVAGAVITADNGTGLTQNATTDGQGLYALADLPAGAYTISLVSGTTKFFQAAVVLSPGQVLILGVGGTVAAQGPPAAGGKDGGASITGTVGDPAGAGVAGAVVTLDNGAGLVQTATTDAQGQYAVTALKAGTYAIAVSAGTAKIFQARAVLSPSQALTLGLGGAVVAQTIELPAATAQAAVVAAAAPVSAPSTAAETPGPAPTPPQQTPASTSGSSITGMVTDQTGAAVVGASVKVSNATGLVQTVVSDDKGNYSVTGLAPGSYTVTATAQGFKAFVADHLNVAAGTNLPLDTSLEPAGEKTEVNVQGDTSGQVETESAQVSGTITQKEVTTLGLNGRNFTQLIALTPGVSNQTGQDEAHVGVTGSVKYSVNGGRVEYNTFEVDGSDVLNTGLNGAQSTLVVYPSLDAIQEVKVLTSNYGAMYGRTASGTVLVTTKSGGANWHGDGYEFFRNEALNARNYFDQTTKAPLYRRNDFGLTIGGPIRKDKTFIFWSEEFRYEKSPTDLQPDFNRGVPSLAERHGDFSDVCPGPNDTKPAPGIFFRAQYPDCPSAGTNDTFAGTLDAFPDNIIPSIPNVFGVLDPVALTLLNTNLIPLPNASGGCDSTTGSCYDAVISEPTHWREDLVRFDDDLTSKLRFTFRAIHDSWNTVTPIPQWGAVQNSFPTVQNNFDGPGISLIARLTHTITPTLLNEFVASYSDSHIHLSNVNGPGDANFQRPSSLGQPGGPCEPLMNQTLIITSCPLGTIFTNGFGGKVPGIVIGGNNQEYGGNGFAVDPSYMPWEHTNPTFGYRDDLSKAIKTHTFQVGAQLIFSQKNETNGPIGAATGDVQGLLTFSNINGGAGSTGNAFANFLTLLAAGNGNAIQSFTQDSTQLRYYNRYTIGEPYIQDDWKVNSRLTVNLGVRFSLFGLFHERYNRAYNWDPSQYSPALAATVRVDPANGQLDSVPLSTPPTPIPINLSNPDPRLTNGLVQCGVRYIPDGCMKGHLFNPAPRVGIAWDPKGDGKTSVRAGYGIFYEHGTGEEANTGSLEASAPLVLNMTQRFPSSYGCIGGAEAACSVTPGAYPLNLTAIPTQAVWSNAQQWSLSVQRELPRSMVATIGYVGSKGTHLTVERQLNQIKPLPAPLNPFGIHEPIIPQTTAAGPGDCGGFVPPSSTGTSTFQLQNGTIIGPQDPAYFSLIAACAGENSLPQSPTPDVNTLRPYPGLGEIFGLQNVADSTYHALQATLRRTSGPLTVGASYTYSHSIDDSSDRSDTTLVNSYDLSSNRASSNYDERHLLNVSYIYTLPKLGRDLQTLSNGRAGEPTGDAQDPPMPSSPSRILRWLGDGWQISGITIFQSGTPFSVINGGSGTVSVLDNAGVANGIGAGSYPDLATNPPPPPDERFNSRSFGPLLGNPNMFLAPRGLTFGDAGRNFLNNPHRINFDLSLLKHFVITEGSTLEFRAEAFNVFNHTQFRVYDPNLGNTGSNVISCYGGPSYSAGFAAPLDPITNASTGADCVTGSAFLHPVDAHRPRTLQLGLKYNF